MGIKRESGFCEYPFHASTTNRVRAALNELSVCCQVHVLQCFARCSQSSRNEMERWKICAVLFCHLFGLLPGCSRRTVPRLQSRHLHKALSLSQSAEYPCRHLHRYICDPLRSLQLHHLRLRRKSVRCFRRPGSASRVRCDRRPYLQHVHRK